MRTVGIIAEYNPFHNGHQYHIDQARRIADADYVVVVMSGDFVQRGEPAIVNKYTRAQMALLSGADLVLELPVRYATGSAEYFSSGAVSLLDKTGIIDILCFGSECGDISMIDKVGQILSKEPPEFSALIKDFISRGMPFPAAREKALSLFAPEIADSDVLSLPNNILGIEYCKAIHRQNSMIKSLAITRRGSSYHQRALADHLSSATAIRRQIRLGDYDCLAAQIPSPCFEALQSSLDGKLTSDLEDYALLLKYRLMSETADSLASYQDVSMDFANKLLSHLHHFNTYSNFIDSLKTKDITYTRIARALLHILLGIKKLPSSREVFTPYGRILGFKKSSSELLREIKQHGSIPLISKLADREKLLSDDALAMLDQDIWCANLYETVIAHKTQQPFVHEISRPIVILP